LDRIAIELADEMTVGALRELARALGKRLVVSFAGARGSTAKPATARRKRRPRRRLSAKGRAAVARNLAKARAVRSAKLKAARKARKPAKVAPPAA
jgi:hypothetical protein